MRRILVTMTLCATLANLGGCVLAVGNGGDDDTMHSSSHYSNNLAHAVRASLNSDTATQVADIDVSADGDRVYLSGSVHSVDVLQKAVQLALDTAGVRSVKCQIVVTH